MYIFGNLSQFEKVKYVPVFALWWLKFWHFVNKILKKKLFAKFWHFVNKILKKKLFAKSETIYMDQADYDMKYWQSNLINFNITILFLMAIQLQESYVSR